MENKISTLFVGVDPHKETHTLVGTNIICEPLCKLTFKNDMNGFARAFKCITETAEKNKFTPLIGLEDSGGNGLPLARFLSAKALPVKTVNPVLVKRERQYDTHPEKSDPRDALGVAKVLTQRADRLPSLTLTQNTEFARGIAILVKDREYFVCEQTKLKNKLHWALQQTWGIVYKSVFQKNIFGKRALRFWDKYPAAADFKRTTKPLKPKPDWMVNTSYSLLPSVSDIDRQHVRRILFSLRIIAEQLKEVEEQLDNLMQEKVPYLQSIPGCGIISSASLVAHIKDINRFPSEKQLAQFTGIAPKKYESGKTKRNKCSSRGHSALRRTFKSIALAQIGRQGNQQAKAYYRKKLKEGKSKKQSLKCLMRQNVKIIFTIMKEQRAYY